VALRPTPRASPRHHRLQLSSTMSALHHPQHERRRMTATPTASHHHQTRLTISRAGHSALAPPAAASFPTALPASPRPSAAPSVPPLRETQAGHFAACIKVA